MRQFQCGTLHRGLYSDPGYDSYGDNYYAAGSGGLCDADGQSDAFRHCYGSALLYENLSDDFASKVLELHEQPDAGKPGSRMDVYNNAFGRLVSEKLDGRTALKNRCLTAAGNGELRILK
jgi:hypothetical protein